MEKLIKYSNGQWSLVKTDTKIDKGHSVFNMDHVNKVVSMKDVGDAKKFAHDIVDSSNAIPRNKLSIKKMINDSRNIKSLALGMSNHILAHPSTGLKVIKEEGQLRKASDDDKKNKYGSGETPAAETPAKNKNEKLYHVKGEDGVFLTEHPAPESHIRVWHGDEKELKNKNLQMVPVSTSHPPYTNNIEGGTRYHVTKDGEALTHSPASIYDIMYAHPEVLESVRNKKHQSGNVINDFISAAKERGINIHKFPQGEDDINPSADNNVRNKSGWVPFKPHRSFSASEEGQSQPNTPKDDGNKPNTKSWYPKGNGEGFTTGKNKENSVPLNLKSMSGLYNIFDHDGKRVNKKPLTLSEAKLNRSDSSHTIKPVYQILPPQGSKSKEREAQQAREKSFQQRYIYEKYNKLAFIHNNPKLTTKEAIAEFNKLSDEQRQAPFRPEDHTGKPYVSGFDTEMKYAKLRDESDKNKKPTTGNKKQELDAAALQRQLQEYAGKPVPNEKPKRPKIFDSLDIDKVSQIMKNHGNSPEALSRSKDVAIGKLKSLLKDETISNNDFAYWRQAINNATDAKRVYDLMFNHINRK